MALKYPIGTQTFEIIRKGGYAYADKTGYVYQLVESGARHVFLSRPRRFGKSLLLSTLQAYFEGRKDLFDGLELGRLETQWESYPVLHFSLASMEGDDFSRMEKFIHNRLGEYEMQYQVKDNSSTESIGDRFGMLIKNVAKKTGKQVVVLIDEYDKGIVDILKDNDNLKTNTKKMRPFYAALKDCDQHLRFVFLTGVSRFRNLTLFSSPNQFDDISLVPRYAAICGLTYEELNTVFAEGIVTLAESEGLSVEETEAKLKLKYDGYRFTRKKEHIYNPFSIINCLNSELIDDYWLMSGGSSKIFIDFLKCSNYDLTKIEGTWASADTLRGAYSHEDPIPMLFQTGYLTIKDYDDGMYKLGIPNGEVRSALIDQLAPMYLGVQSDAATMLVKRLNKLTNSGDADGLMMQFQHIISQLPHQHFRHNDVEHAYHLIMTLICQMAGINAHSEVSVAGGDIDMLIETRNYVYVLELKKDHSAEEALKQIDTNAYALPWQADGRQVFKIGVEFSSQNRNITSWLIHNDNQRLAPAD